MNGNQAPYDLPSEECLILVCSYINSRIAAARTTSSPEKGEATSLPTPPECSSPQPPRRSLDYVAERPNGYTTSINGEEYGIGLGYDEVDLRRQRERISRRFTSKTVPQISISDYLER